MVSPTFTLTVWATLTPSVLYLLEGTPALIVTVFASILNAKMKNKKQNLAKVFECMIIILCGVMHCGTLMDIMYIND